MSDRERNFPDLGFEESEEPTAWDDPDALPPDDWEDDDDLAPEEAEPAPEEAEPAPAEAEPAPEEAEPAPEEAEPAPEEARAIEIVRAAAPREGPPDRRPGEGLSRRVNDRWTRAPGSERRSRIFERIGLPDPYDPDARERPLGLSGVALKLDGKREPAPHARPREAQPKREAQSFAPKVPAARPPAPKAPAQAPKAATPAPAAAPPAEAPRKPDGTIDRRPPRASNPQKPREGFFTAPQPGASRAAPAKGGAAQAPPRMAAGRAPPAPRRAPAAIPEDIDRTPPRPETAQKRSRAGRLRVTRQEITPTDTGPVVIEPPKLREVYSGPDPDAAEAPEPPAPEPVRRIHQGADSLDDLFGFSQNEGRMRLRPKKDED